MNAYDSLLRKERKEAKLEGRQEGASLKEQEVIKNILAEFPQWDNEKIANLANSSVEIVKSIRAEIASQKKK